MIKNKFITQKKGYTLRDFVIAGLLLTGIVALYVLGVAGFANEYDRGDLIDESFSENYDQLSEITDDVDQMRQAISTGEGLTVLSAFGVAFQGMFSIFQLVFSVLFLLASLPGKMLVDFTFLDSEVMANLFILAIAAITTGIIFIITSSVTSGKT